MIDYKQSSMVDVAFDLMKKKKKPVDFYKLWQEVSEIKGFNAEEKEENESLFYTNITLDGRLITESCRWWDCSMDGFAEWTFEGGLNRI